MFETAQHVSGTEPNWLDDLSPELPKPDEWGRDPFDRHGRCTRCGHDWETRLTFGEWPTTCPDCKSPRWFRPPKQKGRTPVVMDITPVQMGEATDQALGSPEWILRATPKQLAHELKHPSRQCLCCRHKWRQRGDLKHRPRACPGCRSPRWFLPLQGGK